MDNYKKALDKAVEYIIEHSDYCQICVNKEACKRQQEIVKRNKIYHTYYPYLGICKDSVRQYFLKQAEADNGTK